MRLSEFLSEAKQRYYDRARRLAGVTVGLGARDVAAFVLCTPRQPYERALRQWRAWRATGQVEGSLANLRAAYIKALPSGEALWRRRNETQSAWTWRLAQIDGLGPVKAAFLACLLAPLSSVDVCLDVWIARHYTGRAELSPAEWHAVQGFHAAEAERRGWRPFPYQWAIWDYTRTAGANGYALVVNETDIGADLLGARG